MRRLLTILTIVLAIYALHPQPVLAQVIGVQRSTQTITKDNKSYFLHTVKRSQTLYSIAKAYNVSEESILDANPFARNGIKTRQSLLIPTATTYKQWRDAKESKEKSPAPAPTSTPVKKQHPKDNTTPTVDPKLVIAEAPQSEELEEVTLGKIRAVSDLRGINVTMLLPFKEASSRSNTGFTDFYKGVLIALESLKREGISVNLDVLATGGSADKVAQIVSSGKLDKSNLVIGPVYDRELDPIMRYANKEHIPIVSPLGGTGSVSSPYLFQAAPDDNTKSHKIKILTANPEANLIVLKHATQTDKEVMAELSQAIPSSARYVNYSKELPVSSLTEMLDRTRENIVVIPVSNESAVEEMLSRLSSVNAMSHYKITVVGTPPWGRFNSINPDIFFKLNVHHLSSYYADRSNPLVKDFYAKYVAAFGTLPTLSSFRGYDVVRFFVTAISRYGTNMLYKIDKHNTQLLQVPYSYHQESSDSKFVNQNWVLINYTPDYRIEIK